ncbi:hypothetical protein LAUMK136_05098 [Mycobacterium attenuatum]|uniref:Uncharacterized protein n=1 Tax=Mycobacterium attenuatum TaxID=2341086 RepID=A0A498QF67_9MYCO|nr:hypothetical protein LAUMK136_05098 [Mycobacterium attenuatum]
MVDRGFDDQLVELRTKQGCELLGYMVVGSHETGQASGHSIPALTRARLMSSAFKWA